VRQKLENDNNTITQSDNQTNKHQHQKNKTKTYAQTAFVSYIVSLATVVKHKHDIGAETAECGGAPQPLPDLLDGGVALHVGGWRRIQALQCQRGNKEETKDRELHFDKQDHDKSEIDKFM
jgi:hypothetical protein